MGKLTDEEKLLICRLYKSGDDINLSSLSRRFGVSSSSIRNILDVRGIENKSAIARNKIKRVCSKCKSDKFYLYPKVINGYTTTAHNCKKCCIERNRTRYKNDEKFREKDRLRCRKYYLKNKDKVNKRIKQYCKDNREAVKARSRRYNITNRDILRQKHYDRISISAEAFIRNLYRGIQSRVKRSKLELDFNVDFLLKLWHKQNGKCVMTDISMTHIVDDPQAVSVDRINSNNGYLKDNIQLVCRFINYAKNTYQNERIIGLIKSIQAQK